MLHQPTILLLLGMVATINCAILAWAGSMGASRRPAALFAAGSLLLIFPAWAMQGENALSVESRVFLFNVPAIASHLLWLLGANLLFGQRLHWEKWSLLAALFACAVTWLTYVQPQLELRVFLACIGYAVFRGMTAFILFRNAEQVDRRLARLLGCLMAIEALVFLHRAFTGLAGLVPAIDALPFAEQIPAWVILLITTIISAPLLLLLLLSRNISDLKKLSTRLSGTLQAMPDMVFELDQHGRYRAFHTNRANLLAVPPAEFLGQFPEDVLPEHIVKVQRAAIAEVNRSGRAEGFEYVLELPDGEHWFEACAAALGEPQIAGSVEGYVFVIRDISERKRSERVKHQFISIVSHELRTPLTSVRGALDALASGVLAQQPDRARQILSIAQHAERQLSALIDDLLDMQNLNLGTMPLRPRCACVRDLLNSVVQSRADEASALDVQVRIADPLTLAGVLVDHDRFRQIMEKLLSNAFNASPKGSTVHLSAQAIGDRVRISIQDQGPGVPENLLPMLFEPFSVADASSTRSTQGAGLGLAIVRKLLERMDGTISYAKAAGGGAVFTIELPACKDPLRDP